MLLWAPHSHSDKPSHTSDILGIATIMDQAGLRLGASVISDNRDLCAVFR